jgi:hypothetical protein
MSRAVAPHRARAGTYSGHPRRVSGPTARPRPVPVPGQPRPSSRTTQSHSISTRFRALPDHRWLDSLLRSRAWIWLFGVALGGIVFMQVSLLGMNAGIGRAVADSTTLQHSNAALEEQVAELSSGDRVRAQATKLGLLSPSAGDVGFLTARPETDARRAAQRMTAPSDEARQTLATDGRSTAVVAATATPVPTVAVTAVPTAAVTVAPTVYAQGTPAY